MPKTQFTLKDIEQSKVANINAHLFCKNKNKAASKKSKYGNVKVEFDGKVFDSKKELAHYLKLRMLLTIGEIKELRLQVPYELNECGTHSLKYIADFTYIDCKTGKETVVDVKGYRTIIYKKKAKLMLKIYGIKIVEI